MFCPHSSAPHLTSRTKQRPQSRCPLTGNQNPLTYFITVSSVQLLDMPFKKDYHVCKRRSFAYVMNNLEVDGSKTPLFAPVLPYTMNETAPKGTASFYVSAVRRPPCYVINYFLAALAAFLFSFHTYASYIIGVPMKMEA